MRSRRQATLGAGLVLSLVCAAAPAVAAEAVYVDRAGVIRRSADEREVAFFGANYCLPSASDYRAAGDVAADRKQLIAQDLAHFARLGWDGMRLAFWGDWENSDRQGNLIPNDHLDLLDYALFVAGQRGLSVLLTPIQRHSSLWPDGRDSAAIQGFSKYYPPAELGRNPAAIAAQQNFLRQLLNHVNPYTGVALKDDPAIVFIELINEPEHHADDYAGSVAYINALVDAVRATGCQKLLFHNLSQDFRMAPALAASHIQGFTFAWYPTGLLAGRTLRENYLRSVDAYTPLLRDDVPPLPRIVYEFDSADMTSGYMYPAMVRAFREAGAQFAAMFAYDMLATAPGNLGWQTHYLNLVYSPRKAVSAVIAAEAMRTLPRGRRYGEYPANRQFGPFRVSYEEDLAEMLAPGKFIYTGDTVSAPPAPAALEHVIGTGSSPVVRYEGLGSYFLDRLGDGQWRLEVYPDAVSVRDPFAPRPQHDATVTRLLWHPWPMQLTIPDLGNEFTVEPLNSGNGHRATAVGGCFVIRPGVYRLVRRGASAPAPALRIGALDIDEFVCPAASEQPLEVIPHLPAETVAGQPLVAAFDLVASVLPTDADATLLIESNVGPARRVPLRRQRNYRFTAQLAADALPEGLLRFSVLAGPPARPVRFPAADAAPWVVRVVRPDAPIVLLDATRDRQRMFTSRPSDDFLQLHPAGAAAPAFLRLAFPTTGRPACSLAIKSHLDARQGRLPANGALRIRARGTGGPVRIALVEADGTTWAGAATPTSEWRDLTLPLASLRRTSGFKLPLGYPGDWNWELPLPADRRGPDDRLRLAQCEQLQIAPALPRPDGSAAPTIELAWIQLVFD